MADQRRRPSRARGRTTRARGRATRSAALRPLFYTQPRPRRGRAPPRWARGAGPGRGETPAELAGDLPDGGERDPGHDGRGDEGLRDHDGGRRVEDLKGAERAAAPEQERDEEPDDDGRQAHPGVHGAHDEAAPRKARQRERGAGRDAEGERDQRRGPRDLEREPENLPDLSVGADDERERLTEAAPHEVHRSTSVLESLWEDSPWLTIGKVLSRSAATP